MKMHYNDLKVDKKNKQDIKRYFRKLIKQHLSTGNYDSITIACIGTDRSTGDSLGPLVGEILINSKMNNVDVIGNLEYPLHAKNLEERLKKVNPKSLVIAVDACLGADRNIGCIYIEDKPISPGAAMDKNLPKTGKIAITGIVNISGSMEFMVLQNTRLHTVMELAKTISIVIKEVVPKIKLNVEIAK